MFPLNPYIIQEQDTDHFMSMRAVMSNDNDNT